MNNPWQAEQERQMLELAEILQHEINRFGARLRAEGRQPMLNAVAGALTTVTGGILASVEDKQIRKELRRAMERSLPRAIALNEGKSGTAEIVRTRGSLDS